MKSFSVLLMAASFSAIGSENPSDDLWDFLPEAPPTSEISLSASLDSDDGSSRQLSASFQAPADSRVSFAVGDNKSVSDFSSLKSRYWHVGWSSDPAASTAISLGYDVEDNDGALDIDGFSLGLSINFETFSIAITPQLRNISMQLNEAAARGKKTLELDSRDITVAIEWFGDNGWSIGAEHSVSNYSRDPGRLATERRLQLLFSPKTLELSTGLGKQRTSVSVVRALDNAVVGMEWSRSVSAVTESVSNSVSVVAGLDVSRQWRVDLGAGLANADYNSDQTFYGSGGIAYRW